MAVVDVKVPSVGESVKEGMIQSWVKADGSWVETDDILAELETDKATVEIISPAAGILKTSKKAGDTVAVGQAIAQIDTAAARPAQGTAPAAKPAGAPVLPPPPPVTAAPAAPASTAASAPILSPAARKMVEEGHLDAGQIAATGRDGRITKGDVIAHQEKSPAAKTPAPAPAAAVPAPIVMRTTGKRTERREPMTMLRRRIAERLVGAQHSAALLTTFNEVDMTAVMALRKKYKDTFKEKHGVNLGFMGFFVKAAVEALTKFPALNGWVEGNEIVYHDYCDVGVAVSTERGLVVPVIRNAETLTIQGIEATILGYANKARDGKISVDDMNGGTFTISNGGVFGSLLSTPIVNPPQSGILGMHRIDERAVVVNGQIVIRPMMYLALTYDHRIVDGREAVQFLVKIKDCIEDPMRLLLEV
jgi:2-oxoglutarate dehydrogenase E2 component (dihydrolipoamide succinyltransferase)